MCVRAMYEILMAKSIWSGFRLLNWSSGVTSVSALVEVSNKLSTAKEML